MNRAPIFPLVLGLVATVAHGQQSARIVKYHANDIVSVRARMRYTTLIQLPVTEKILEVATGDKDFWIIDAIGNYCFLHPAKEGIHSNLNLITDKGTVYSFTLDDVETSEPDLKVVIEPSDPSSLAATNGTPKLVPSSEVDAVRAQAGRAEAARARAAQAQSARAQQMQSARAQQAQAVAQARAQQGQARAAQMQAARAQQAQAAGQARAQQAQAAASARQAQAQARAVQPPRPAPAPGPGPRGGGGRDHRHD